VRRSPADWRDKLAGRVTEPSGRRAGFRDLPITMTSERTSSLTRSNSVVDEQHLFLLAAARGVRKRKQWARSELVREVAVVRGSGSVPFDEVLVQELGWTWTTSRLSARGQ